VDNKEILEKLQRLSDLLSQYQQQYNYYEEGCALEALERIEQVKTAVSTLPGVPSVANAMPVFPVGEKEYLKAKGETAQSGKITMIALVATVASLALWFITKATFFAVLGVVAGVVWYVVNKNHKNNKQGLAKKEKAYNEAVARSNTSFEKFRKALSCYEQEVADGLAAAKAFGQLYCEKCEEHSAILADFEKNKDYALMQCSILSAEIDEHDYIPKEYHHHISKLISLLQSGRADSYKEALNMAIEEERQAAIEAARQEEEARRLAAMERQAEEERRHNMMLERQQAAHDRAMQRAAQEQAEEQRRANIQAEKDRRRAESEAFHQKTIADSEARKQAAKTRMAGVSKCANCRNNRRCPSGIKESGAGLTCGGYQPY